MKEGRRMEQQEMVLDARAPASKLPLPPRVQEEVPKQEVAVMEQQNLRKEQMVVAVEKNSFDMVEYEQQPQSTP